MLYLKKLKVLSGMLKKLSSTLTLSLKVTPKNPIFFRHNTALLEKNYRLHINYMPRSNFLFVPCLA